MCSSGRGGWARVSQPELNLLRDSARNEGAGSPVLDEVWVEDNLLYQLPGLTGEVPAWSLAAVRAIPLAVSGGWIRGTRGRRILLPCSERVPGIPNRGSFARGPAAAAVQPHPTEQVKASCGCPQVTVRAPSSRLWSLPHELRLLEPWPSGFFGGAGGEAAF